MHNVEIQLQQQDNCMTGDCRQSSILLGACVCISNESTTDERTNER